MSLPICAPTLYYRRIHPHFQCHRTLPPLIFTTTSVRKYVSRLDSTFLFVQKSVDADRIHQSLIVLSIVVKDHPSNILALDLLNLEKSHKVL